MQGWNSMNCNILGRDLEAFSEAEYDDDVDIENAYGGNKFPIGRGEGNYAAKFSLTLFKEESDALQNSLPKGGRIQDIPPFDTTFEYEGNAGTIQKDRIYNCQFKNKGVAVKQGDKTIGFKYTLIVSHIDWNI